MRSKKSKALAPRRKSMLTAREFHQLAAVPPEVEWLANITNERDALTRSTSASSLLSCSLKSLIASA